MLSGDVNPIDGSVSGSGSAKRSEAAAGIAAADDQNLARLTQAWINERSAPEILPYEGALITNLMEMVDAQVGVLINEEPGSSER
jgi:hypothetical protein